MKTIACPHSQRQPLLFVLAALVCTALVYGQQAPQPAATKPPGKLPPEAPRTLPTQSSLEKTEETIELSPFVVTADSDVGYLAANTLAGSRLNTPLRDTAATINVLTAEFLSDLGVLSVDEAFEWMTNTVDERNINQSSDNNYFSNPNGARVRGVATTRTRNYFAWTMPTDTYNVDRIEDARGPNSVLFGIGSASGVINVGTKQANTSRNFSRAGFTTDDNNTLRGTLDVNRTLKDGKLALRLNAVYTDRSDNQHFFAGAVNKQATLAVTYRLDDKTRIRAEYERGEVRQVLARPGVPADGYLNWIAQGSQTVTGNLTSGQQSAAGVERFGAATRITLIADNANPDGPISVFDMKNQYQSKGSNIDFQDNTLIDFRVNMGGPGQIRFADFDATTVLIERQLGKKTFIELAFNRQAQQSIAYRSFTKGTKDAIRIDPNQTLPNGTPNPNVGRLFTDGAWARFKPGSVDEDTRLSATTEFDLGKWGNYRLAFMASHHRNREKGGVEIEVFDGRPFNVNAEADPNVVYRRSYFTPSDWSTYYLNSPVLTPFVQTVDPVSGKTLTTNWVSGNNNYRDDPSYQDTLLLGLQAYYFKGRLVVGAGMRNDWLEVHDLQVPRDPDTGAFYVDHAGTVLAPIDTDYKGRTHTVGTAYHVTDSISLYYNRSSNFALPNLAILMIPDGRTEPNKENDGQDIGIGIELFKRRVNVRANYYETHTKGASQMFGGAASNISLFNNRLLSGLLAAGAITQAEYDAREMPQTGAGMFEAQYFGYELNVTGNITKNWRIVANYSHTDAQTLYRGREVNAWWEENKPYFQKFDQTIPSSNGTPIGKELSDWENNYYLPFVDSQPDGSGRDFGMLGNRPDKVNLYTNYRFDAGVLRGLSVGAGYRFQSKQQIGTYADADSTKIWGNSYWTSNASLGYRLRHAPKWMHMKSVSFQLNVDNVTNNRDLIINNVVVAAPRLPGSSLRYWGVTMPRARSWRFSTNVEF